MSQTAGRILSIQSHVAFGYVGGKAAVFPLQCLGYDVDVVNTVNFSNHSGYGRFGGSRTTADELSAIFRSMEENYLLTPKRLLTGYIPGAEALTAVAELGAKLKKDNPDLVYLLDPVMGDAGKLYVAPDVIPVYQAMLPLATIITPNWFEVETLTNIELKDLPSLRQAIRVLHEDYHVPNVVISSIPLKRWLIDGLPSNIRPPTDSEDDVLFDSLLCVSSSHTKGGPNLSVVHAQYVPLIPGYFSGVGDLFSALLLGHFHLQPDTTNVFPSTQTPVSHAVSLALTKTHAVLRLTFEHSESLPEDERQYSDEEKDTAEPERKIKRMKGRELRLVQGQDLLRGLGLGDVRTMEQWEGFWGQ